MAQSTDPGHFFQTDSALASSSRKAGKAQNTLGSPIALPSKILAVLVDPTNDSRVYVAESAGTARRVDLDTKDIAHIFRGAAAPLTSLAFSTTTRTLYAGCWDKSIWSWNASTRAPRRRYFGHADFVKAVICMRAPWLSPCVEASSSDEDDGDILISGGADACIIVWRASTGAKLHTLRGHTRGILSLALAPLFLSFPDDAQSSSGGNSTAGSLELYSAGSDPSIRRWRLTRDSARELAAVHTHATSIAAIRFHVPSDASSPEDAELWTASADKTAQCLTPSNSSTRDVAAHSWSPQTTLPHADFVRDVLAVPGDGLVVTACRDEGVRVWDANSGDGDGDGGAGDAAACVHVYDGHFDEVTALAAVKGGRQVVSVGIDGTVRRWDVGRAEVLRARAEARRKLEEEVEVGSGEALPPPPAAAVQSLLTAEEEAELAALMEEEDE